MLNNLKSDLYRTLHSRFFYVIVCILCLIYLMIAANAGVVSNTSFARFDKISGTVTDFLFYLPKSNVFTMIILIFFGIFVTDEHTTGFAKNTYPLFMRKWDFIMERYLFSIIMILVFTFVTIIMGVLGCMIVGRSMGDLDIGNYIVYLCVQLLILATVSMFVMMLAHLTHSKLVILPVAVSYGQFLFILHAYLISIIPNMINYLPYTLGYLSGNLAYEFSFASYKIPLLVMISSGLLYGIGNYFVLKKKDL